MMKSLSLFFSTLFVAFSASALTLEKVDIPEKISVAGKSLTLNGAGLRKVTRFGIPVKVYVGALYLEKASQDSDAILNSSEIKRMEMTFVRPVDRDALNDSFRSGYESGCFSNCDKKGEQFMKFSKHVRSVRKDNKIILTFHPDMVFVETTGPNAHTAEIKDADLSKNLLAVFINKKNPPTEEFRDGVLGIKSEKK